LHGVAPKTSQHRHPCREYWGQDVACGSLGTDERPRRAACAGALTEVWILDLRHAARVAPHAGLAGVPSEAVREEASALPCAEFMRHLGELGAGDGVARIDWVMVRAADKADAPRSHLGATRVARVALKPFAPGAESPAATAAASSAAGSPAG
jgi:hypothetical protein